VTRAVTKIGSPGVGERTIEPPFGVGILGTLGHYLLILSYGRTSPATLSPYLYTQIAFATLAGWLVFSHAPDAYAVAGILVIAGCGIAGTQLRANAQRARGPAGGDR
jgi:drug/metabolite transporter (DMT)-like permease